MKLIALGFLAVILVTLGSFVGIFVGPTNLKNSFVGVSTMGIGLLLLAGSVQAIFTGEYKYGRPGIWQDKIKKADKPFGFWFVIFFMSILGGVALMVGSQCFFVK
jgi:hypothetical protein